MYDRPEMNDPGMNDPEMNDPERDNPERDRGEMDGDEELGALRNELSRVPAGEAPPIEAIMARGRAQRRRRRSGLAGAGVAAAVVVAVLLASLGGAAKVPSGREVHVNLAAYSVDSNANGTVTVTMARQQTFDPKALKEALAAAGVVAVVKVGAFCRTVDQPPGFTQVVVPTAGSGQAGREQKSLQLNGAARSGRTAVVISPSAMPRRAELSIGYFPDHVAMTLVATNTRLTCGVVDPANCQVPVPAGYRAFQSSGPGANTTLPGPATTTLTASASTLPASATSTLPASATSTLPASATSTLPASATSTLPASATTLAPSATTTVAPPAVAGGPTASPPRPGPVGAARLPVRGKWCEFTVSHASPAPSGPAGATTTVPSSATTTVPGPTSTTIFEPAGEPDRPAYS